MLSAIPPRIPLEPATGWRRFGGDPAGPVWVGDAPFGPTVTINTPAAGATVVGTTISILYDTGGNLTGTDHIHFRLDDGPERPDYDLDGVYQIVNVPPGQHTVYAYLVRSNHTHATSFIDAQVSFQNLPDPSDPIPASGYANDAD